MRIPGSGIMRRAGILRIACAWLLAAGLAGDAARAEPPRPHEQETPPGSGFEPRYQLTVRILDGTTGTPTAARVRVIDSGGLDAYPWPARSNFYHEAYSGHHYFYADGEFTVDLPQGRTVLWISRGFEYWAFRDTFDVVFDEPMRGTRVATLSRFTDQSAWGWRSGDTHIHTNHSGESVFPVGRDDAFVMQRAEDLNVADLLEAPGEFTGVIDPRSDAEHLLYVGGEYRSAFWGHLDVLGVNSMPYLFCCSAGQPAFPMNVDLVRDARSRGGMVFYAHPITVPRDQMDVTDEGWPSVGHGRELPIDVALGTVDALDIYSYSNLNRLEFQTWYDLLNHGFRIPATAGTDASVNRTIDPPMGGYRVYAQLGPGAFTHDDWLEALRRGESFLTNGPLIRSFLVDGAPAGTVLTKQIADSYSMPVSFNVVSQWPMSYLALVVNGSVQSYFYPTGDKRSMTLSSIVSFGGYSGWVALMVVGTWPNPGPFFTFGNALYAHSNPVYVDVPGRPRLFGGTDPLYYVQWIDDVWALADARGWNSSAEHDTVLARVTQVPFMVLVEPHRYSGIPNSASFYDPIALKRTMRQMAVDLRARHERARFPLLRRCDDRTGCSELRVAGRTQTADYEYQFIEGEYMKEDEYDMFLNDPSGFMIRCYLPRVYRALMPLAKLPPLDSMFMGFEGLTPLFASPEFQKMAKHLAKAGKQVQEFHKCVGDANEELAQLGFPPFARFAPGGVGGAPLIPLQASCEV